MGIPSPFRRGLPSRPGPHRVPLGPGRAAGLAVQVPALGRPLHGERDHAEAVQPVSPHHRSQWSGTTRGVPLVLSRVSDLLFWCDPIFKILGLSLNSYHNIIIIKAQLKSIRMF